MPRLPAKQREAEKICTQLSSGSFAAAAHDAPSKNAYQAHANSLLASLSNSRNKRKKVLEGIISALKAKREEFRKEKKTGAGSATEAIDFYKFALTTNAKWKGDNEDEDDENEMKKSSHAKSTGNENQIVHDSKLRCKICELGSGDLFQCCQDVCQNAFHLTCIRPMLNNIPPKDWSCAYCDVEYVTGLKPQARKRRASVAAVRAMEKFKADLEANKSKKRSLDDQNDAESSLNRPQRQRLISDLKKDGDNVDKDETSLLSKQDIPQDILKLLSHKTTASNSKHNQFHCKFCMDNEILETCCFCACRVCFSKHDRTRTILCDICDSEYHMDCLSPPLLELPSSDWFCPTCINFCIKNGDKTIKRIAQPSKKSSNKVGKKANISKAQSKAKVTKASRSLIKADYASKQPRLSCGRFAPKALKSAPTKRGPGRPPKSASAVVRVVIPKKKGPGRPRGRPPKKSKKIQEVDNTSQKSSAMKSSASKTAQPSPPRKRGRPPKNLVKPATDVEITKIETRDKNVSISNEVVHLSKLPSNQNNPSKVERNGNSMQISSQDATKMQQQRNLHNSKPNDESVLPELSIINSNNLVSVDDLKKAQVAAVQAVSNSEKEKLGSNAPIGTSTNIDTTEKNTTSISSRAPRRKPGARECMQISRRFGANIIPQQYMDTLLDYCTRGKVEHLIRMRERLDEHSRFLELQLAGLEMMIEEKGSIEPTQSDEIGNKNAPTG